MRENREKNRYFSGEEAVEMMEVQSVNVVLIIDTRTNRQMLESSSTYQTRVLK